MQSVKLYTGSALKTLTNAQIMDPWSDWDTANESDFTVTKANKTVAWFYRCVVLRASAVSNMPFIIEKNGKKVEDWPYFNTMKRLLYLTEASLCHGGDAYWLKQSNRVKDLGCRWLAPSTMQFEADSVNGLTSFERTVGGKTYSISPDQVVYFWMPDPNIEVGPGMGPGEVALQAAGIASSINEFSDAFFKRGAIPAVLLTVEGNPSPAELKELREWWRKLLRGAKNAWETIAVRAQVKPQIIQQPAKDLAMPELKAGARAEIAVAFGVPETMLEESAANYATAVAHRKSFYTETIIPECGLIEDTINEQWLKEQGLRLIFQPEELEVMQEDEAQRSLSVKNLVDATMPLKAALILLGYDIPDEVQLILDEEKVAKEERREQMAAQLQASPTPPALPAPQAQPPPPVPAKSNGHGEVEADLERWRRKALKALRAGKPAAVFFESDAIPEGIAAAIQAGLELAVTTDGIKEVFAGLISREAAELREVATQHQVATLILSRALAEMEDIQNDAQEPG
jgi:HK97 family phage portal protein